MKNPMIMVDASLVGSWALPLWKILITVISQLGWWHSQQKWLVIKFHGSKPHKNQYMPRHSECINCAKPDPRVRCFWMVSFSARSSSAQERLPGGCGMLRNVADHLPPNRAEAQRTRVKSWKNSMITQEKNGLTTTCSQNHGVHNCSTPCSPQLSCGNTLIYPDAFLEEPLKITQVKSLDSICFIKTPLLDSAWCEQSANIQPTACAPRIPSEPWMTSSSSRIAHTSPHSVFRTWQWMSLSISKHENGWKLDVSTNGIPNSWMVYERKSSKIHQ